MMQKLSRKFSAIILVSTLIVCTGCKSMTEDTQSIQPAALSDTTAKTLNEIRNILAAHKERNNLKLGAIDKDLPNVISVLPRLPSKHDTLNFERPELFNIVVRDGQCFAQSQDDNALVLLSGISCKISG